MSNTTNFPNQNNQNTQNLNTARPQDDFAAEAGNTARRAGAEAGSLADEAKAAAGDLGDRAKQGVADAADHIRGFAEDQKSAGAERFKGYAGSINRAADSLDEEMPAVANFARRAAGELDHLADSVKDRDLSDLVGVAHDYARRQPAIFLGATALAGFLAVRFLTASAEKRTQQARASAPDQSPGKVARPGRSGYAPS